MIGSARRRPVDIGGHSHVDDPESEGYTHHYRSLLTGMASDTYVPPSAQLTYTYPPFLRPVFSPSTLSFRLVSYNIRYDIKPDNIAVKESLAALSDSTRQPSYLSLAGHEQPWSTRRIRIAQDLLSEGVVLAGACYKLLRMPRSENFPFDAVLS